MINRLKYKVRKLVFDLSDEFQRHKKPFQSGRTTHIGQMTKRHLSLEEAKEEDLEELLVLSGSFSVKRIHYFSAQDSCSASRISPVVLAYTHVDGELLKDLELSIPE